MEVAAAPIPQTMEQAFHYVLRLMFLVLLMIITITNEASDELDLMTKEQLEEFTTRDKVPITPGSLIEIFLFGVSPPNFLF